MENYTDELQEILDTDKWQLQTYPGKHSICGIVETVVGLLSCQP